jgi:hypothetical protein
MIQVDLLSGTREDLDRRFTFFALSIVSTVQSRTFLHTEITERKQIMRTCNISLKDGNELKEDLPAVPLRGLAGGSTEILPRCL